MNLPSLLKTQVSALLDRRNIGAYRAKYIASGSRPKLGEIEGYFASERGTRIPVYRDYRFRTKCAWQTYRGMLILDFLASKDRLTAEERAFHAKARDHRRLTTPIAEINATALASARRHPELFVGDLGKGDRELPFLKPSQRNTEAVISSMQKNHRATLNRLHRLGFLKVLPSGEEKLLEIGFSSGGHSIFAWERLGFQAYGIDNSFYGSDTRYQLPYYLKDQIGSRAEFIAGDVTDPTSLGDQRFDVVTSIAVLEHVHDLRKMFLETRNFLKDDGLLIHEYNPVFSLQGGHSEAILDCPWGHVRMRSSELPKYFTEFRPFEADFATQYVEKALNFETTIARVQALLAECGYRTLIWEEASSAVDSQYITPEVINQCFDAYPHLSLADLLCSRVFFVARKS
jgi:SAM-dependent methyltransferase